MPNRIPEIVILRLPMYRRALHSLEQDNIDVVSSQELGERLQVTPAQIRKDLSYFGKFGKQGMGYNVKRLLAELTGIMGLDGVWPMVLVGEGRLGTAIARYPGFVPQGFRIVAAFDSAPQLIGRKIGSLAILDISEVKRTIQDKHVDIGIVAVPGSQAQRIVDMLVASGARAILNYAPADT